MKLSVFVDGKKLFLNPFMTNLTGNLLEAICRSLKADRASRLEVYYDSQTLRISADGEEVPIGVGSARKIVGRILRGLTESLHGAEQGKEFTFIYESEESR
jgi:hypothetical protein